MSWRTRPLPRCSISTASRLLRRLQGPQQPVADARARRDARHHRPQRRRQDHDDGHHHRQDQAGRGRRCCSTACTDLTRLDEAAHRQARHRPQVPEADRVREPDGRGQSAAGAERRSRVTGTLFWRGSSGRSRADRPRAGDHPPDRCAQPSGGQPVARPEAVARDRHAAGAGPEAAAGRRAGRRHDRRRDAADRGAAQGDQQATRRSSSSSTT